METKDKADSVAYSDVKSVNIEFIVDKTAPTYTLTCLLYTSFQIDFDALEERINAHTRGVIINSPNNPSGTVYSEETIKKLSDLLEKDVYKRQALHEAPHHKS